MRGPSQKKKREERGVDVWAKLSRKQTTYPTSTVALKVQCAAVDCEVSEKKSSLSSSMRPLHDLPTTVSFQLKESHSGYLCKVHATRLSRQMESALPKAPVEEKATWLSEKSVPESRQEKKKEEPVVKGGPKITEKKPVGRPPKYGRLERLQIALLAVSGVSLSSVSDVFEVMAADNLDNMFKEEGPKRTTVVQCLQELYQAYKYDLAAKMAASTSLNLMIDATSDSGRELLALHLASTTWRRSVKVVETVGHKAQQQVDVITSLLDDLNTYQKGTGS